jgi:hypothetical protein
MKLKFVGCLNEIAKAIFWSKGNVVEIMTYKLICQFFQEFSFWK